MRSLILYDPVGLAVCVFLITLTAVLIIYHLQIVYRRAKRRKRFSKKKSRNKE
jgi:hypothetical protein